MAIRLPTLGLDCQKCTDIEKQWRGCVEDSTVSGKWKRCPVTVVSSNSYKYIRAHNMFKKGFLPNPGTWLDQSAKLIEVFNVLDHAIAEVNKEITES